MADKSFLCWTPATDKIRKCGVSGPNKGVLREIIEELEVGKFYQKRSCDKAEHSRMASTMDRVINEFKDRIYKINRDDDFQISTITRIK